VTDSGAGISPEFMPFVFDRFRQADSTARRSQGGLGIGLSVVRDIMELHGGSASVTSAGVGRGATFIIHFPPSAANGQAAAHPGQNGVHALSSDDSPSSLPEGVSSSKRLASSLLQGLRVLLVDDDTDARDVLQEVLSHHDAQVTAVGSVSEALEAFADSRPHVLVSDIAMPGEDGFELIRRIRSRSPEDGGDLPAMALTAYARQEDVVKALAAGFQRHASKPIEPEVLVSAVASLAGRVRPRDEPGRAKVEVD
jgi:CheY-like chemotaxis protein